MVSLTIFIFLLQTMSQFKKSQVICHNLTYYFKYSRFHIITITSFLFYSIWNNDTAANSTIVYNNNYSIHTGSHKPESTTATVAHQNELKIIKMIKAFNEQLTSQNSMRQKKKGAFVLFAYEIKKVFPVRSAISPFCLFPLSSGSELWHFDVPFFSSLFTIFEYWRANSPIRK